MITSLNVNQFLKNFKEEERMKIQGKHKEKVEIWKCIENYYYNYIKEHLKNPGDLLVLHEVPYRMEEAYFYGDKIKFKRSKGISESYISLEKFCRNNGYEILKPSDDDAFILTVAIFKKGEYKRFPNVIEEAFTELKNRIIALERAVDNSNEIIIALHIPIDCEAFWVNLKNVHDKLPKQKRKIYIGDLNTYNHNKINYKKFCEFLSINELVDVWIKNGNLNTKATFDGNTRIDYVLMTEKDFYKGSYKIIVDDTVRSGGYSDHSAIIMQELYGRAQKEKSVPFVFYC